MASIELEASPLSENVEKKDVELGKNPSFRAEAETESIAEAVESSSSHNSSHENVHADDLEKATTRGSHTSQKTITRIITAQDWQGPDDPGNPMNWSVLKKALHTTAVAFLAFAVSIGSSLPSPANVEFQQYFHVSRTAAILPLTLFVLGLGFGPLIAAPLSEKFGRTMIYRVTPVVYILFLIGAGFSKSFGSLVVCRLLAGISGAPVLAVGTGTNADLYGAKNRAVASATYVMAPFLGPAFGPVIGGFATIKGWRWTIWCNIFIGVLAFLACLPMQETYKKVILQKRAKKYNLDPPPAPSASALEQVKRLFTMTLARPMKMLLLEPTVLVFSLYSAFTFSVLFAFFEAFPYTFESVYGFNTWQYGLTFIGIGIGVVLGTLTGILCDRLIYQKKLEAAIRQGRDRLPPEERLYAGMIGAFGLPIGLFWFAWTARRDVHWISPVLAGIPFAFGNISLFISTVLYLIDVYGPLNGASATAANGFMRYTFGGCFPLFTFQMYETLGIGWATSLLGFVCVALLPIPFVFYKFGPFIRSKSRMSLQ